MSKEEKLKEVVERLQEIAKKQMDIKDRLKKVEQFIDSKETEDK